MNIEQAKQIPLRTLIENFGGRFSYQRKEDEAWYYSPFRPDERTASLKVNISRNTWIDFGNGQGGSTIDLWLDYNNADRKNSQAISNALKAFDSFNSQSLFTSFQANKSDYKAAIKPVLYKNRFQLTRPPTRIFHDSLKQEIGRRGLSLATVSPYLKQAYIKDTKTKKTYYGFAFLNDLGGWEISIPNPHKNKSFKTGIGKKAPSFIEGKDKAKIDIFEGFWDYLSWLQMNKFDSPKHSTYVMNSLSFKTIITEKIIIEKNSIEQVFLFLDNDNAGEKVSNDLLSLLENHIKVIGTKNYIYKEFKDINDFCQSNK